ncbi:MAG: hypothetical protein ACRENJ_03015 [Candidatus Eiseniibacteriota bacterium]
MTESTFLALLTLALLLLEGRRFLAGGLALGASYLVRPEAAVVALGGLMFGRTGWRGAGAMVLGIALVTTPYLGWMRLAHGAWELTPKTALVRPQFASQRQAEWRLGDQPAREREPKSLLERLAWAAPSIAANYLPLLKEHLVRLLRAWPWPLLLLSLAASSSGAGRCWRRRCCPSCSRSWRSRST